MSSTFSKRTFFLFFIIVVPLFLNLNVSGGLRFDAGPFNVLAMPSLPLMLILFSGLAVLNVFNFRFNISELVFILLMILTLVLSFTVNQNVRSVLLAFGMVLPLFFTQLFVRLLRVAKVDFENIDFVSHFYAAISTIIMMKFTADIVFFGTFYSEYFIFGNVVIYNAYDYFPFVYLLVIVLSVNNVYEKKNRKVSFFLISVSLICAVMSYSRLFCVLAVIAIPTYIVIRYLRLKSGEITFLTSIFVIAVTILVALLALDTTDQSLDTRFSHWHSFFSSFEVLDIFFPLWNAYRIEMNWGTFHNELLEIYSYYGFIFFLYLYVLSIFFTSKGECRYVLATLLFFFLIGGMIQLNLTNPYIAFIVSALCASIKCNDIGREKRASAMK